MLNVTQEWEVMKDMTAAVSTLIFLSTFLHLYMTAGIKSRHINFQKSCSHIYMK